MTIFSPRIGPRALIGVSIALAPVAAFGQGAATGFAGVETGRGTLAYAGASVPLGGAREGGGWALRPSVAYSRYDYRSGGQVAHGESRQAELSLLRQASGAWGYADFGLGARYRSNDLASGDSGSRDRWEVVASTSGQRDTGAWRVSGFGSYGFGSRSYYVRGEADRRLNERLALGVEAVFDGDKRFSRGRAGLVATVFAGRGGQVQLAAGGARSSGRSEAYGALRAQWSF